MAMFLPGGVRCFVVLLTLCVVHDNFILSLDSSSSYNVTKRRKTIDGIYTKSSHSTMLANQTFDETQSVFSAKPCGVKMSPCTVTLDNIPGGGSFVNCSNRDLREIKPDWFPANTTRITLDNNNIHTLVNGTFSRLTSLRSLNISMSNISKIQVDALSGLVSLQTLYLEDNNLPLANHAFPPGMFSHVPNLLHLFIAYNNKHDASVNCVNYTDCIDIFDHLPKLQNLSIDAFRDIRIGTEFEKFQNLSSLVLFCGATHGVYNDSFKGLANLTLKHLEMREFLNVPFYFRFVDYAITWEVGVFQHLPYLESLTLYVCPVGNKNVLKSLLPFQNRNMTSIILHAVGFPLHYVPPGMLFEDGMISETAKESIGQICVSYFAWSDSQLYGISPLAIANTPFIRCAKTVDLSSNNLQIFGWVSLLYIIPMFSNLDALILLKPQAIYKTSGVNGLLPPFSENKNFTSRGWDQGSSMTNISLENAIVMKDQKDNYRNPNDEEFTTRWYHQVKDRPRLKSMQHVKSYPSDILQVNVGNKSVPFVYPYVTLYMPPVMKTFMIDNYNTNNFLHISRTVYFAKTENFKELIVRNMPLFIYGPGRLVGFYNLTTIDFSGSLVDVEDYFWDEFPALENLTMRSVKPDNFFQRILCKRLIHNMPRLKHLDISNNDLNWLLPETFSSTPELAYLSLAKNRFSDIPFDLSFTPKLEVLDLTDNAILYFTAEEMAAIDRHVEGVHGFSLKLQGNNIVCVCSRLHFLVWQRTNVIHFDSDGNYSCTSEDGQLAFTADLEDIEGFWRQCRGEFMLMVSLVLASLMALMMLMAYFVGRFKTAMMAFLLRVVAPQFRPMTSRDYKTDVFIGYADEDYRFVRNILKRYLEEELQVTTFIHDRDFGVGYKDQLFFDAIQDSWRVLLVITDTFLHRYDMANIVMKFATHSVSLVNQDRVFVLAQESQLRAIPDYLHDVLDDTKIIVINDLDQPLGYEQEQSIKNCLRPV